MEGKSKSSVRAEWPEEIVGTLLGICDQKRSPGQQPPTPFSYSTTGQSDLILLLNFKSLRETPFIRQIHSRACVVEFLKKSSFSDRKLDSVHLSLPNPTFLQPAH